VNIDEAVIKYQLRVFTLYPRLVEKLDKRCWSISDQLDSCDSQSFLLPGGKTKPTSQIKSHRAHSYHSEFMNKNLIIEFTLQLSLDRKLPHT